MLESVGFFTGKIVWSNTGMGIGRVDFGLISFIEGIGLGLGVPENQEENIYVIKDIETDLLKLQHNI